MGRRIVGGCRGRHRGPYLVAQRAPPLGAASLAAGLLAYVSGL